MVLDTSKGVKHGNHDKHCEYNPPLPPPPGWSGGTLVPPWTYPGTIDPLPDLIFDQARLSNSLSDGFSAGRGFSTATPIQPLRCRNRNHNPASPSKNVTVLPVEGGMPSGL